MRNKIEEIAKLIKPIVISSHFVDMANEEQKQKAREEVKKQQNRNATAIYNAGYRKESETAKKILTVIRRQYPPTKDDIHATLDDCYMIDIIEDLACKYGVDLTDKGVSYERENH